MADIKGLRAATLRRVGDLVDETGGALGRDLPPFTKLLVWTTNALYRVIVTRWPEVYVNGRVFVNDQIASPADGASSRRTRRGIRWISAGRLVEIRSGGLHIISAPILAVTEENGSNLLVH